MNLRDLVNLKIPSKIFIGPCRLGSLIARFMDQHGAHLTVGQRSWMTAVSHLPTWWPPKQANKARPGLVYYNHHTLTQVYTQIDMGRRNSVPENRDLQSLNFVTRTLCIFGGMWRTQRCEVEDSVCLGFGGGGLQFPMHASIDLSRYISYVEEFFYWSLILIFRTRHKHALTEATLWLQINCKHIFVQLRWSMWIQTKSLHFPCLTSKYIVCCTVYSICST